MRRGFPATHSVLLNCKLCFLCMVCGLAWAHTHLLKAFKTGFCFRFTFIYKHLHFMNHSQNNMHYIVSRLKFWCQFSLMHCQRFECWHQICSKQFGSLAQSSFACENLLQLSPQVCHTGLSVHYI